MRQSPRRPLILKRRKLPFQQSDPSPAAAAESDHGSKNEDNPKSSEKQSFPDGVRIMDHPTTPGTQVVVIPKNADLQSIIGILSAKGKECGPHGPNKFILLSGSGSLEDHGTPFQPNFKAEEETESRPVTEPKPLTEIKTLNRDLDCSPLDDSLTNIQWLGKMHSDNLGSESDEKTATKENQPQTPQEQSPDADVEPGAHRRPASERPPYSYMAIIQFAINSKKNRRMTLKEIYTWIEDHFPYFRDVAKPGWKNSIRHNLSLHDMFIRETSHDKKISLWTIRPEANRCLTLYQPGLDPTTTSPPVPLLVFQNKLKKKDTDAKKATFSSERKMKPLLPRTNSYFVPIQLPVASSLYFSPSPSSGSSSLASTQAPPSCKRVRIAPKVTQHDAPAVQQQASVPLKSKVPNRKKSSGSRRKQSLVLPWQEEPVLVFPDSPFCDSGVASDVSATQDTQDTQLKLEATSPCRDYTFKTPIKASSHLASSTPSKPPTGALTEPWKVTPVSKDSRSMMDFSPIRTPKGPAGTPQPLEYNSFSLGSTPFKDLVLFNSPKELLSRSSGPSSSPGAEPLPSRSLEPVQAAISASTNHSFTEGLVLDTMNDSLSKILVDISFSSLEDEEMGVGNISWSEFFPQLK